MPTKAMHEKIEKKAEELSAQLGVKVHPIVFLEEAGGEEIVGYLKEPSRLMKVRILDKSSIGPNSAAVEMLEEILIKEHSDRRIWEDNPKYDKLYLGAANEASMLIQVSKNQFKKK